MKTVNESPETLSQDLKGLQIRDAAPSTPTTDKASTRMAPNNLASQSIAPSTHDETMMTVINSDGTVSYYTSAGVLVSTSDAPRPSEATKAVIDSDRVTAAGSLKIRSKRTERMKRKLQKKTAKSSSRPPTHILDLPNEILAGIVSHMLPSDIFKTAQTCQALHQLVQHNETLLSRHIISERFSLLEKCFRLPVTLDQIEPKLHDVLQNSRRMDMLGIHRKYQHIPQPNPFESCTCLTCVMRWNALCIIVDFNNWQSNLTGGEPIPIIPRGQKPEWNEKLLEKTYAIVLRALRSPLAYAHLLELHLKNTCAAIKRQSENKSNQRPHFKMSKAEAELNSDQFLDKSGPATVDMPFHRDNYYFLEAYLPNRTWLKDDKKWVYMPADLHDRDLDWVAKRWGSEWSKYDNGGENPSGRV